MPLTNTAIIKAKPGPKPIKLSDERGLYLLLNPNGARLWRWKYRIHGKEKLMAFGAYPDVSLAQARERREEARKTLAAGVDPMVKKKAAETSRKIAMENSFATVSRDWWAHWSDGRSETFGLLGTGHSNSRTFAGMLRLRRVAVCRKRSTSARGA